MCLSSSPWTKETSAHQKPRRFLLHRDLELPPLRSGSLSALPIEGEPLLDELQLSPQERNLIVQSPTPLPKASSTTQFSLLIRSQTRKWEFKRSPRCDLVQVQQDVIEGLLSLVRAPAPQRPDRLDRLLRPVLLLHDDGHVLEGAVDAVAGVDGRPEQRDRLLGVLIDQLTDPAQEMSREVTGGEETDRSLRKANSPEPAWL